MRILINAIPLLSKKTGIGNYIYFLSKELKRLYPQNEYVFYYGFFSEQICGDAGENGKANKMRKLKSILAKVPALKPAVKKLIYTYLFYLNRREFDIYFEPNFIPALGAKSSAVITSIPDFSFTNREWTPDERYAYFGKNFWKYIYKSDYIITISDFIRKEAIERLKISESKIRTIHLGVDTGTFKPPVAHKKNDYILYAGSIQPRKNLKRMVEAYLSLPEDFKRTYSLYLVGFDGWNNTEIMEMISRNDQLIKVIASADSNETLADYYRNAALFVYPSLYEGFGLTALEAMACGCPVVASNTSSIPEICGDAAFYVNPLETESIADAILKIASDETVKNNMSRKGIERASYFTWEKTAEAHIGLFKEALRN